jgi:hypothetical protein
MRGAARVEANHLCPANAASRGSRPRSRGPTVWQPSQGGERGRRNDKGAAQLDESLRATRGEKAPGQDQPWTWLRDGISLQSRMAEKTVERLRKPEDGT